MPRTRLTRDFYRRDTLTVARELLDCVLCRRVDGRTLRGRIVEVEAYDGPDDRASHAHRGRTKRNTPMFDAGGIAYVYLIYGMHHCFNVVTGTAGYPAAVLIRATERPTVDANSSGPGRLSRAFAIDRELDGMSLLGRTIWLERAVPLDDGAVRRTPRIGVDYAGSWARKPYRFVAAGHPEASGPRSLR